MYESGDTPTENAIMAAVLSPGKSALNSRPLITMVQDLCYFLVKAGAKIQGIGSTTWKLPVLRNSNQFRLSHHAGSD